ncbi:hypothetical protein [uncultured Bacteroides sp.]|uniref:hypothetical protein n=1 Tax=uncultured Bacteroides sp. TaxID=162156 RepID=UPI002633BB43|nr:hypothetical protein [uncultured Bacteroides sp.]
MIVSGAFGLIGIEDGIGYEDIYTLTTGGTAPSKPASENVNDYVPSGWYASPQSVTSTKRYQWVCKRSKKNGTWSAWSTPVEYNRYVEDGQDGTDGVGYEYCYKATQYNVRPDIPTSEASGAGIPTGWSSSAPDISAINAYIWESYRTVKGSSRSYWQTPRLKNRWSYDGAQGSKGAKMRMTVWKSGERYLQGAEGEEFYDIVIKGTQLSLCIKTHTADSSNAPDISTTHWESAQQWAFIATQLLIAGKIVTDKITADLIDATGITAKNGVFVDCIATNFIAQGVIRNPWKDSYYESIEVEEGVIQSIYDASSFYYDKVIIHPTFSGEIKIPWDDEADGRELMILVKDPLLEAIELYVNIPSGKWICMGGITYSSKFVLERKTLYSFIGYTGGWIVSIVEQNISI